MATSTGSQVFAAILAGGSGVRMGNPDKPKQFCQLGGKPILVHTVEKFTAFGGFTHIILLCPQAWLRQTSDIIARELPEAAAQITVIAGGKTRNDTIQNAIAHINANFEVDEDTILVTHDAVRPFVSMRILEENIQAAAQFGACDTVIPATDTIVESTNAQYITNIPNRSQLYQGQTPQSFKMRLLERMFEQLAEDERTVLTDACKVLTLRGEKVALVQGDVSNIKLTYPHDLRVAEAMLGQLKA